MSLALISETEEIKRRKAVAKEHFDAIKEAGALHSTTSMRIGYHAYRLKAENLFGVLGFADENEARVAAGVGESTWYANIRLAEQFKDLPEKRFVAMKQANAKALAEGAKALREKAKPYAFDRNLYVVGHHVPHTKRCYTEYERRLNCGLMWIS